MKKYLIILLCILLVVYIYILRSGQKGISPPREYVPVAQISLADHIESSLNWQDVSELLNTLAKMGCVDAEINGFYWDSYPCLIVSLLPEYDDLDELVLQYRNLDPKICLRPQDQYDLKVIQKWCERHTGQYSTIYFGDSVKFSAVKAVTQIFLKYDVPYFLNYSIDDDDNFEIRICLHQNRKINQLHEPNPPSDMVHQR